MYCEYNSKKIQVGENRVKRNTFLLSIVLLTSGYLHADQDDPAFRESIELRQIADYWKEQEFNGIVLIYTRCCSITLLCICEELTVCR